MALPLIPLTLSWENARTFQANLAKASFGEGGLSDRSNSGINKVRQSFPVTAVIVGLSAYTALRSFLTSANSASFQLSYDGTPHPEIAWSCKSFEFSELGVDVWRFSAQLEQRFRLGV